jgi:hypothetical protein
MVERIEKGTLSAVDGALSDFDAKERYYIFSV